VIEGLSDPESNAGKLQRACLELIRGAKHALADAIPTSIRFLFYELVQMGIIPKHIEPTEKGKTPRQPQQNVSDAVMHLRELGLIPWSWIKDETRRLLSCSSSPSVGAYLLDSVDGARINPWGKRPPPMILTESKSLAGVLELIAYTYACPIAAVGGQVGGFLHTDIIPALVKKPPVIYFGDLDKAAHDIENNIRTVVEAEVGELEWTRLALTPEQVEHYKIESKPKTDRRFKKGDGESLAYECEALSQIVIQDLLRDHLKALLLPTKLDNVQAREERERKQLRAWLKKFRKE
jgi:hypothetical protein